METVKTSIHLTELITCQYKKYSVPEIILELGKRAHEKFYARFLKDFPEAEVEFQHSVIIDGVEVYFTPDIVNPRGNIHIVYELKSSYKKITLYLGAIQLLCYCALLDFVGYNPQFAWLIVIDRDGNAVQQYGFRVGKPRRKVIFKWIKQRVELLKNNALIPCTRMECRYCETDRCPFEYSVHEFPLHKYITQILWGSDLTEFF